MFEKYTKTMVPESLKDYIMHFREADLDRALVFVAFRTLKQNVKSVSPGYQKVREHEIPVFRVNSITSETVSTGLLVYW